MINLHAILLSVLTSVMLLTGCSDTTATDTTTTTDTTVSTSQDPTTTETDEDILHTVEIEVADYGVIVLELNETVAPISVENFLSLVESDFYDGLTFHRIMSDFMIQGGDPEGTGMGGSDTTIKGEFSANGVENNISHVRGTISMARSQSYDSASSQFFIVHQDSTFLDGQYAAFGTVISGMDVVDAICADATPTDGNGTISAENQPIITDMRIIED